jgi:integrase/recombinase XerD
MTRLPALIQQFFTDRLCTQMEASPNTIAGYRDTSRLLLQFASERTGKAPIKLTVDDLDCELVGDFLTYVETQRRNSVRSRNTRLAAIRSFFRFVAISDPSHLLHCQRILAMPGKRYVRRTVEFLNRAEMDALLAAPDLSTWIGRRDYAILVLALQTGLRASEIVNLRCGDVVTGTGAHVRCEGKGRKQRCTPIRRETLKTLDLGSRNAAAQKTSRSSRQGLEPKSVGTLSKHSCEGIRSWRRVHARRSLESASAHMCSGTAPRWTCCTTASTNP